MGSRLPMVQVFAGPNGSGKSSITNLVKKEGIYVNADDIQRVMHCDALSAAQQAEQMRYSTIDSKQDLTFEKVLSTDRNLKFLEYAKQHGYFIKCYYILTASSTINVQRVAMRVLEGGHDVPTEKIINRYDKCMLLVPRLISLCNIINIYDNTCTPVRIFSKKKDSYRAWSSEEWSFKRICELIDIAPTEISYLGEINTSFFSG